MDVRYVKRKSFSHYVKIQKCLITILQWVKTVNNEIKCVCHEPIITLSKQSGDLNFAPNGLEKCISGWKNTCTYNKCASSHR